FKNPFSPAVAGVVDALPDGPSYPVLVDAIGWRRAFGTGAQSNVGGGTSYVSRRSVSFVNSTQDAFQWFTLLDDIDFENAAAGTGNSGAGTPRLLLPSPPNPAVFTRDIRY